MSEHSEETEVVELQSYLIDVKIHMAENIVVALINAGQLTMLDITGLARKTMTDTISEFVTQLVGKLLPPEDGEGE